MLIKSLRSEILDFETFSLQNFFSILDEGMVKKFCKEKGQKLKSK